MSEARWKPRNVSGTISKNLRDDFDAVLEFPHILFFVPKSAYNIGTFGYKKGNMWKFKN